jgi:hypothetical protein
LLLGIERFIVDLYVSIPEAEINEVLPRFLPPDLPVKNLRVQLTPQGLVLHGEYPTRFLTIRFEILWEVAAIAGNAQAKLTGIKVAGLPAGLLRGLLLSAIRDSTKAHPAVQVENDIVRLDVRQLFQNRQTFFRIELKAVRTVAGSLIIEAGPETRRPDLPVPSAAPS